VLVLGYVPNIDNEQGWGFVTVNRKLVEELANALAGRWGEVEKR
jgi:hypothetical protein